MLLIGSRAARLHFSDFREAKDWDVVVDEREYADLVLRLGLPVREPTGETSMFRHQGTLYELKRARHRPLWSAVLDHEPESTEGEFETELPVLGHCRIASPPLLLILKQCFVAYPIHHWRKSLLDYHFLKERIRRVPPKVLELSQLALEEARERFGQYFEPQGDTSLTCAHAARKVSNAGRHRDLHDRFSAGTKSLVGHSDAWQGFSAHPVEMRRSLMIELLVEEALVVARERQEDAREDVAPEKLCHWTLRMLITQHLPLPWRYFAADHFPQIQAELKARNWGA